MISYLELKSGTRKILIDPELIISVQETSEDHTLKIVFNDGSFKHYNGQINDVKKQLDRLSDR